MASKAPFGHESLLCAMATIDMVLAGTNTFDGRKKPLGDQTCQQEETSVDASKPFANVTGNGDTKDSEVGVLQSYSSPSVSMAVNEDSQQNISIMIKKHWYSEHGLPRRYLKSLIYHYVSRIEEEQDSANSIGSSLEVSDELMEALAISSMPPSQSFQDRLKSSLNFSDVHPDEWGHLSYMVPPVPSCAPASNCSSCVTPEPCTSVAEPIKASRTDVIPLKIRVFPYHNDVGVMKLWEAGACLAEYLTSRPNIVSGKRVVELGAGVGVTGLIASSLGADHVQMTDHTGTTLENLEYNLKLNLHWLQNQRRLNGYNTSFLESRPHKLPLASSYLEWNSFANGQDPVLCSGSRFSSTHGESVSSLFNAEVLLAADVCYLVDVIPSLVQTVKLFLQEQPDDEKHKCAYFATTLRNKKTFDVFVEHLLKNGIFCKFLDQDKVEQLPNIFPSYYVQPRSDIRICKLQSVFMQNL